MDEQVTQNKFLVPLAIVVAGALVAGAIYFGSSTNSPQVARDNTADVSELDITPVNDRDHILGNATADIIIIEYSDTECPFCKVFHNTMKEVVRTYGNKVAWVYRQFPIPQLHSKAMKEAEAMECVAELAGNQAFWSYLDKIFVTTNSNDSLDLAQLPILAASLDIPQDKFNTCLNSGKYTDFVKKSMEEAYEAGARGTPYSVIINKNGDKDVINGAEPIASVKTKIDALLK
ncbi:MAG: disulfide bond formation protein DsbA [Candidatus Zambryskibacteria bacterium]|nr:disulfide bond formation protein DsbA [Candidatus Zambryskibacteria bacterium]